MSYLHGAHVRSGVKCESGSGGVQSGNVGMSGGDVMRHGIATRNGTGSTGLNKGFIRMTETNRAIFCPLLAEPARS